MTAFQLIQTLYWLALASWFGSVLFVVIAWPVVFTVMKEEDPTLPRVLSVNVDHDHASLLAGTLMGALVRQVGVIQLGCAAIMLVTLVCQWFVMSATSANHIAAVARCTLFAGAAGLLAYDRWLLWPRAWNARSEFIENADDPDIANPIRERFDRHQRDSLRVLLFHLILLSLIIVFSASITPRW